MLYCNSCRNIFRQERIEPLGEYCPQFFCHSEPIQQINDEIANTIGLLNENHYYVDEARLKSESIYIQFDGIYSFSSLPKGFNTIDTNCYDCPTGGLCRMDGTCEKESYSPKTILIYTEPNYNKTPKQLEDIASDLDEWVLELTRPLSSYGFSNGFDSNVSKMPITCQ